MGAKKTSQDDLDIIKTKTREELESMALTLLTRTHSLSKELKDKTEKLTKLSDTRFDGLVQRVLTLARFVYVKPTGCYPIRLQLVDGAGNWEIFYDDPSNRQHAVMRAQSMEVLLNELTSMARNKYKGEQARLDKVKSIVEGS